MGWTSNSPNFTLQGGTYRSSAFSAITVKNIFGNGFTETLDVHINRLLKSNGGEVMMVFETLI